MDLSKALSKLDYDKSGKVDIRDARALLEQKLAGTVSRRVAAAMLIGGLVVGFIAGTRVNAASAAPVPAPPAAGALPVEIVPVRVECGPTVCVIGRQHLEALVATNHGALEEVARLQRSRDCLGRGT